MIRCMLCIFGAMCLICASAAIVDRVSKPLLSFDDAKTIVGGDGYDDFSHCDKISTCTACVPNSCVLVTTTYTIPFTNYTWTVASCDDAGAGPSGNPGCASGGLGQSECFSNAWSTDCLILSTRVCGASKKNVDCWLHLPPACAPPVAGCMPLVAGEEDPGCWSCSSI